MTIFIRFFLLTILVIVLLFFLDQEDQEVNLVLQPDARQGKDTVFSLIVPDNNYGKIEDIHLSAWTKSGRLNVNRVAIEFD